jgi:Putative diphthamide synthesis protein
MTNESASYRPLISYLRQVLTNAHKKAYTISVGKLNPAKLANFAEIECFVLVACPENSLIDAKVQPTSISSILLPSDKLLRLPGLLPPHCYAIRAATCATAFTNMDWRVCARFR